MRTIVRFDTRPPLEQIPGADLTAERAQELIAAGKAEQGPVYNVPPAVYMAVDMTIRGVLYREGQLVHLGEISEAEMLALLRGVMQHGGKGLGGFATVPGGGVG